MNKISHFLTGTVGVTGIEIANNVDLSTISQTKEATSLILQLVIGIVTLWKMLKKPKTV